MGFFCLHLFFFFSWARRSWLAQVFFCFLFFVFAFIFISKYFGQWWEDREAWPVNWMSLRSQILSRNHSWKNYSNESLRKNKMTVLDQVSRTRLREGDLCETRFLGCGLGVTIWAGVQGSVWDRERSWAPLSKDVRGSSGAGLCLQGWPVLRQGHRPFIF